MSERFFDEVGLYCSLADEMILLTFDEELVSMLGGDGYAIHSACCSCYTECGCEHYGVAAECKSVFQQAVNIVRINRSGYTV